MHRLLPPALRLHRRRLLQAALALGWPAAEAKPTPSGHEPPQGPIRFPRDRGSHPDFRTEWWYVTGHGKTPEGREFGYQVTFFRSRVDATQALKSGFAARQLLFAHAAVTDVSGQRLLHDQRIARASGDERLDQGSASAADTALTLRDWSLHRTADGRYQARVVADDFELQLRFQPTQPVLLQGRAGRSRKGPEPRQASWYYSEPQLAAEGRLVLRDGRAQSLTGTAWLDHEWSEELLPPQAVGWDWIGMNLFDGSALMAFQLRSAEGRRVWDGGAYRHPKAGLFVATPGEVAFQAGATWKSPATQAQYPVEWLVRTPADFYVVKAVIPAQELDSRASTGAIYWEGLSDLFDGNHRPVGRGYLEMTGYAQPLQL